MWMVEGGELYTPEPEKPIRVDAKGNRYYLRYMPRPWWAFWQKRWNWCEVKVPKKH